MTPLEYLMRYRLLKAKEMLIENNATTAHEIAKAVGFNSASYFGSVFKKYEGISLSSYASSIWIKAPPYRSRPARITAVHAWRIPDHALPR